MTLAAILFGIAAAGGVLLLLLRLKGGNPPLPLAMLHGLLAASGLVALVIAIVSTKAGGLAWFTLGLFVLAAGLGFAMVRQHLKGRVIPIAFVIVHALTAVFAYSLLLVNVFGR
jgi:hypothetical protein